MATLQHLANGSIFARDYRVLRPLAEGGMGAVYVVEQLSTGHRRALKIMHPQLVSDPRSRERFLQEARLGSQIDSAHIVAVTAAGIDEQSGTPWLAMEHLEGADLAQMLARRGAFSQPEVHALFEQLGEALGRAHAAGIVHRDLKPENLFLAQSRLKGVPFVLKVLDFGIAKMLAEHKTAATVTTAIGSPLWMSPEQGTRGARVRPSTDVWALGLIAFTLLTGRIYWLNGSVSDDGFNLQALYVELMVEPIAPASARAAELGGPEALPDGFDGWFARCVVRDPDQRFQNAAQAVDALLPMLAQSPAGARATSPSLFPMPPTALHTPPTEVMKTAAMSPALAPRTVRPAPRRALWIVGSVLVTTVSLSAIPWFFRPRPSVEIRSAVDAVPPPAVPPPAVLRPAVPSPAVPSPAVPSPAAAPPAVAAPRAAPSDALPARALPPLVRAPHHAPTHSPVRNPPLTPREAPVVTAPPTPAPATPGVLSISARPYCQVLVDGVGRGMTPMIVPVAGGQHTVTCTGTFGTQRRVVTVVPDQHVSVRFEFPAVPD